MRLAHVIQGLRYGLVSVIMSCWGNGMSVFMVVANSNNLHHGSCHAGRAHAIVAKTWWPPACHPVEACLSTEPASQLDAVRGFLRPALFY